MSDIPEGKSFIEKLAYIWYRIVFAVMGPGKLIKKDVIDLGEVKTISSKEIKQAIVIKCEVVHYRRKTRRFFLPNIEYKVFVFTSSLLHPSVDTEHLAELLARPVSLPHMRLPIFGDRNNAIFMVDYYMDVIRIAISDATEHSGAHFQI